MVRWNGKKLGAASCPLLWIRDSLFQKIVVIEHIGHNGGKVLEDKMEIMLLNKS